MNHDETIKYYQMRAGEYDKVYTRDNPGRQEELAGLFAKSSNVLKDKYVLDIACGTGYWTRIVSQLARSIVGVDINPATIAEAEKKSYGCPVQFVVSDVFDLPFPKDEFDGLMVTYLMSHIKRQDLDDLADRIRAVVKPGAAVFICDNNLICEMEPDLIWDDEHINSYKKRRLESGREYKILKNYFPEDELTKILRPWGKIEKLTVNTYYWSAVLTIQ